MTIVAGFHIQDGILLCADSMYTGGTRINQPKLFSHEINSGTPDSCTLAFALAGHEVFGKMAIEDCVDAITACTSTDRTFHKVKLLLRKSVKAISDEYVDSRPDHEKDLSRFELLIAAWLPRGGGLHLFRSSGPGVLPAGDYHCAGIGAYLGDYLMRNAHHRSMRLNHAVVLAIQGLAAAKKYDANCGGDSQFMMLAEGGRVSSLAGYDVHRSEAYISEYELFARRLLFAVGDPGLDDREFHGHLTTFAESVKIIRDSWKLNAASYEKLVEALKQYQASRPTTS